MKIVNINENLEKLNQNIKDDFFYKGDIQMFFQSDKFQNLKLKKLD